MTSPDTTAGPEPISDPTPPRLQHGPLRRSIHEGLVLMALNLIIVPVLQVLHLRIFLASEANSKALKVLLDMNPLLLIGLAVIAAPLIEETVFRGIPYLLWKRVERVRRITDTTRQRFYWLLGIGGAALFAVCHGEGSLPLPQMLLGLWSWHVINTRGLRYSMVLHASYNFVPIMLMLAGAGKVS